MASRVSTLLDNTTTMIRNVWQRLKAACSWTANTHIENRTSGNVLNPTYYDTDSDISESSSEFSVGDMDSDHYSTMLWYRRDNGYFIGDEESGMLTDSDGEMNGRGYLPNGNDIELRFLQRRRRDRVERRRLRLEPYLNRRVAARENGGNMAYLTGQSNGQRQLTRNTNSVATQTDVPVCEVLVGQPFCAICLENFFQRQPTSTSCGHVYCLTCIQRSVKELKKCPVCNRKLTLRNLTRIYL